jgi:alkane 1-monooxygenase
MTRKTLTTVHHLGFLFCILPTAFLWIDLLSPFPALNLILFFVTLPLLRQFAPIDFRTSANPARLPRPLKTLLHTIPHASGLLAIATIICLPPYLALGERSMLQTVGVYLSAWITISLSTCVLHDLTHRKSNASIALARLLGASIGYPHFVEEHRVHHAVSGGGYDGDSAHENESLFTYVTRSAKEGIHSAWEWERTRLMRRSKSQSSNKILQASSLTLAITAHYAWFAGLGGALFYLLLCAGAVFSFRSITFIQHWGLREAPPKYQKGYAWDSNCLFQSWVTLNVGFHEEHHQNPSSFYFKLHCAPHGLRLPYTYPVMFILALFPGQFERVMRPRLHQWMVSNSKSKNEHNPNQVESCFLPFTGPFLR